MSVYQALFMFRLTFPKGDVLAFVEPPAFDRLQEELSAPLGTDSIQMALENGDRFEVFPQPGLEAGVVRTCKRIGPTNVLRVVD